MTNSEIKAFLTIVKTGSITSAAEVLYVTQPALSRRIKFLEEELGYSLMRRRKGVRAIELTDEGRKFVPIAEKWLAVWEEAKNIGANDKDKTLNIASVGSVGSYIIPGVFRRFLQENPTYSVSFYSYHSVEAYNHVEAGAIDIAFISDDIFSKNVETIPAFKEPMVFVTGKNARYPQTIHPSMLDALKEIRIPWNPEYDSWHDTWFGPSVKSRETVDQMSLLEDFWNWDENWAVLPYSAAYELSKKADIVIGEIENGPPDRIIYYLLGKQKKMEITSKFLSVLHETLKKIDYIYSYLN
jgi:DNA-binding transcriptional LysR family regulator